MAPVSCHFLWGHRRIRSGYLHSQRPATFSFKALTAELVGHSSFPALIFPDIESRRDMGPRGRKGGVLSLGLQEGSWRERQGPSTRSTQPAQPLRGSLGPGVNGGLAGIQGANPLVGTIQHTGMCTQYAHACAAHIHSCVCNRHQHMHTHTTHTYAYSHTHTLQPGLHGPQAPAALSMPVAPVALKQPSSIGR